MARSDLDWRVLQVPLIVFTLGMLLGAALIVAGAQFRDRMQLEFRDQQARFRAVSQRYLAVDDEARIINDHLPAFRRYFEAGIIGTERRLDWVAALRDAGAVIGLPELGYEIDSQALYAATAPIALGEYDLYGSRMHLTAGLLHEQDFARLLQVLDARAPGMYQLARCSFERASSTVELDPQRPNVAASCDLIWLTLRLRGGQEIRL